MSRIGRQVIIIPASVALTLTGQTVVVKGPKGELPLRMPDQVQLKVQDGQARLRHCREPSGIDPSV